MPPKGKKNKSNKKPVSFDTKVKKPVIKMAEKKQQSAISINNSVTPADTAILPYYAVMTPALAQSATEIGRIGNKVKISSAYVKGYVNLLPYNVATNTFPDLKVRLLLVSYKRRNVNATNLPTLALSDVQDILQVGGGGIPFQGNMTDVLCPINNEVWTVYHDKVVTLSLGGSSTGYGATTTPHSGSGSYQTGFNFSMGKALNNLNYDDDVGSQFPTNKNLWLIAQPITTDGGARQAGPVCEIHWTTVFNYTDV